MAETVTILKEDYVSLKKKASLADDILFQLEGSLKDALAGRVREARH